MIPNLESWWLKMVEFDLRGLLIPRKLTLREFSKMSGDQLLDCGTYVTKDVQVNKNY